MDRIFISGFPCSGKTTIGKIIARKIGWDFIDTDSEIEKLAGKSIPRIFKEDSEDFFRYLERKVIAQACSLRKTVISLGGGAITSDENLKAIRENSLVVTLTVELDNAIKRLGRRKRPLLEGDPKAKFEKLVSERLVRYKISDLFVKTDDKSPDEVANEIIAFAKAERRRIRVNLGDRSYDVIVGSGILKNIEEFLGTIYFFESPTKWLIITSRRIKTAVPIDKAHFKGEVFFLELPEGELTKGIRYAVKLWNFMGKLGFKKNDVIVVLGGGVLGDLVGFVASCWARGIRYIQIPTTLLAQVDSAIGGKTAVNTKHAKNIIGTIWQPSLVVCDTSVLKTLPEREFRSGLAEVLKYAFIKDKGILDVMDDINEVVARCASIKAEVVSEDEDEKKGLRFILNFGHTVGHAIETSTDYRLTHGEAVAIGMCVEALLSERLKIAKEPVYEEVKKNLQRFGLPTMLKTIPKGFEEALELDKKGRGRYFNMVLLRRIGEAKVLKVKAHRELILQALKC